MHDQRVDNVLRSKHELGFTYTYIYLYMVTLMFVCSRKMDNFGFVIEQICEVLERKKVFYMHANFIDTLHVFFYI